MKKQGEQLLTIARGDMTKFDDAEADYDKSDKNYFDLNLMRTAEYSQIKLKVDPAEQRALFTNNQEAKVKDAFRKNEDTDGYMDVNSLRVLFKKTGIPDKDFVGVLSEIQQNFNGKVNFNEFDNVIQPH